MANATAKYFKTLTTDPNSWYNKPEMLGHRWARETVDLAAQSLTKNVKTKLQQKVAEFVFQTDAIEWHYFINRISKKYIAIAQYVIRHLDKLDGFGLYCYVTDKQGMCKDETTWLVEWLAYSDKRSNAHYKESYCRDYMFFGMSRAEAAERYESYHQRLNEKYNFSTLLKGF